MHLAVGVVTYHNEIQELARFCKAFEIAVQKMPPHHSVALIWIDNGHPQKPCTPLSQWIPQAVCLPSEGNVGYTRSINRIMRQAFEKLGVDAFVSANPDGAFHHLTLENFIRHHLSHPTALLEAKQFPEEHPKVFDPQTLETPWSSGCCLFIPKLLYKTIGPLDDQFFMYMEDVDFSWRTRAMGFPVKLCPDALYAHAVVNRSVNEVSIHQHYLSARYLGWKWGHRRFFRWAEKTLLKKKGFTRQTLPELPKQRPSFSWKQKRVTCFGKVFSFGERRW